MLEQKVTCDHCGKDLTSTNGMPKYRLELQAVPVRNVGGSQYAVIVNPPIKDTHHFCSLGCLEAWVTTR